MEYKKLEFKRNTHELGINYVQDLLDRAGFAIHDVNKDLKSPFQLFTKVSERALLIAVRTAYHPNVGTIDEEAREKLIEESEMLDAIPHFAGLSLISTNVGEHKIFFNGMTVVR